MGGGLTLGRLYSNLVCARSETSINGEKISNGKPKLNALMHNIDQEFLDVAIWLSIAYFIFRVQIYFA